MKACFPSSIEIYPAIRQNLLKGMRLQHSFFAIYKSWLQFNNKSELWNISGLAWNAAFTQVIRKLRYKEAQGLV